MPLKKQRRIVAVFKKYPSRAAQCRPVQNCDQPGQAGALERRAQPLDIGAIGDSHHPACQTAVNIGLDGIGQHQIRPLRTEQLPIGAQRLEIRGGVDASAVYRCLQASATHAFKIFLMPHKRGADDHFIFFQKGGNELLPEPPEHIGVVCEHQYLHLVSFLSRRSMAPVPPSTTPLCRNTARKVPKKHLRSMAGPKCSR